MNFGFPNTPSISFPYASAGLIPTVTRKIAPIIKPIQAVIGWFKKLVKPVEDTGGAAEKMGVRFGKAIANIIVKIVELITKVFEFGKKIGDMLAGGILSKIGKTKENGYFIKSSKFDRRKARRNRS